MQVTHAALEDARAVAEIHVDTWRAAYASIVPADTLTSLSVERREAMWRECIASGAPELLVAKEAGLVRGWLSFGRCRDEGSSSTDAEVWAMYVSPSAWSTGAGRLLWLRARALMIEQGFTSCSLWVFPQNDRAIKFYHAAGFAQDGSTPTTFELGGAQLQEVRFVTRLDDPVIREIRIADIPALFHVRPRTRENALTLEELRALGITPESVADWLAASTCGWLCETATGEVVGFCMADRSTAELLVIALLPPYEERGIGGQLMQRAEAWLARSGCTRAWLTTDLDPTLRAYGFYRHRGWTDWKLEHGMRWMQLMLPPA